MLQDADSQQNMRAALVSCSIPCCHPAFVAHLRLIGWFEQQAQRFKADMLESEKRRLAEEAKDRVRRARSLLLSSGTHQSLRCR